MSKHSYHPFKMHGSYIGLVLGFVLSYFTLVALSVVGEFSLLKPTAFLVIFAPLVVGFLLGWGFHSVVRVMRD
ncbi:MAG: hypothetical protein KKD18_03800 [Nanoarchaeota archaeon]|nr:hypothetical protein [Nanoarchaeota archaeon]MBU0977515.1 hypothetical protein [Nanoarchaeota archaeon]